MDRDDLIDLAPRVAELAREIASALSPDGPGGRRVTRAELRRIGGLVVDLAGLLWRAVL